MKALVVPIYEKPYVTNFSDFGGIKRFLMGYVEHVTLSETAILLCNEEGKIYGFTPNRPLEDYDIICGDFVIVGHDEEDFCDLSDADIAIYTEKFSKQDVLYMRNDNVFEPVNVSDVNKKFIYYDLLQCEDVPYKFMSYKTAEQKGIKLSDYHNVYHAITPYTDKAKELHICERLYTEHNTSITDRRGHSMSVSDIIVLRLPDGDKYYYTDVLGFTEMDTKSSCFISLD